MYWVLLVWLRGRQLYDDFFFLLRPALASAQFPLVCWPLVGIITWSDGVRWLFPTVILLNGGARQRRHPELRSVSFTYLTIRYTVSRFASSRSSKPGLGRHVCHLMDAALPINIRLTTNGTCLFTFKDWLSRSVCLTKKNLHQDKIHLHATNNNMRSLKICRLQHWNIRKDYGDQSRVTLRSLWSLSSFFAGVERMTTTLREEIHRSRKTTRALAQFRRVVHLT